MQTLPVFRIAVTEALGERIGRYFELCGAMALVSSNGDEFRLAEYERAVGLVLAVRVLWQSIVQFTTRFATAARVA